MGWRVAHASRCSHFSDGGFVHADLPFECLHDKPEFEQRLPSLVGSFQQPLRLRLEFSHDIAGEISAYRRRLFPGSFGIFKDGLNAGSVGKLASAHLKAISRHACD